jgi:hypothetical protein
VGSLSCHTFACICIITMQHWLSPASFTCITIGFLHRKLSHWEQYRLTMFRMERNVSLDAHSNAKGFLITKEYMPTSFLPSLPFWPQRINHFRCLAHNAPYIGFTYIHHTDSLALTRLAWLSGGTSSRDSFPVQWTLLHCQTRYFIQTPRVIWRYRWFTLIAVNSVTYDCTSHGT